MSTRFSRFREHYRRIVTKPVSPRHPALIGTFTYAGAATGFLISSGQIRAVGPLLLLALFTAAIQATWDQISDAWRKSADEKGPEA